MYKNMKVKKEGKIRYQRNILGFQYSMKETIQSFNIINKVKI